MLTKRYVMGLMSGTSTDGIDVVLARISHDGPQLKIDLKGSLYEPYSSGERERIFAAFSPAFSVYDMGLLNRDIGMWFARAVNRLLDEAGINSEEVQVIGSHGQTIAHYPPEPNRFGTGFCVQIGDPAVIACETGIDVVSHFRAHDMALGGQGAPLIPYFDYTLLHSESENRVVLNIGGIANVTLLEQGAHPETLIGFDTGPGNMVLDGLINMVTEGRCRFDQDGAMAKAGAVHESLLAQWLRHPYFTRFSPKSTGREEFGLEYCRLLYEDAQRWALSPEDLLRTATELVGISIAQGIRREMTSPFALIASGGGTHNLTLMSVIERESALLRSWESTTAYGISGDFKEALAFALFAWQFLEGIPTNMPRVTGARRTTVQGSWTPARSGTRVYGG